MYDVAILGGGPGGYKAAELLSKAGNSVAIIEKGNLGGTCLNKGCIPLKNLLHIGKVFHETNEFMKNGIITERDIMVEQSVIREQKNRNVSNLRNGLAYTLRSKSIQVISENGYIEKKNNDGNFVIRAGNELVESKKLIIATGSSNRVLFEQPNDCCYKVIDSDDMLMLDRRPNHILIIGAGVIGLESASYFKSIGSKVVVIDIADSIGTSLDREVAVAYQKNLERKGIVFHTSTKVTEFGYDYVSYTDSEGNKFDERPDYVLVAVGRKANVENIGLENIDITCPKGYIETNEYCETGVENVYACGDVNGKYMLAHVAYKEARIIASGILGQREKINYGQVPSIIYTNPEVASVGLTEEQCIQQNVEYKKAVLPMAYNGRYFIENGKDFSIVKIIVDSNKEYVLGFHMIGNYSSEIVILMETIIINRLTLNQIKNLIFPHPTVGEIIQEALEML